MTTAEERTRAVLGMAQSARALAPYAHGDSPNALVPRELLEALQGWLRHYPSRAELSITARQCPGLWAPPGG